MAKKPHDDDYELYKDVLSEWLEEMMKPRTLSDHCRLINLGLRSKKLPYLSIVLDDQEWRVHELRSEGEDTIVVLTRARPRGKLLEKRVPADTTAWRLKPRVPPDTTS